MGVNPAAQGEFLEQRAIKAARGAVVDVLDGRLMAQSGEAQAGQKAAVAPVADFLVEQQSEPFGMGERCRFIGCFDLAECLGHAGKSRADAADRGLDGRARWSPNGSSASRGYWDGGWRA
jgi:hypothetical protein